MTHKSTGNGVLDLFAMGAAYRHRSDEDCIFLFKKAFEEDEVYALKCLFYLRDARGGQGERRFWRVCADKAKGPFAHSYVSFSRTPRLVEVNGVDFCDKVARIYKTNLCENTNIEATFDMLLNTALKSNCSQADLPQNLIIISDMEFDNARNGYSFCNRSFNEDACRTLMENIEKKWNAYGYKMPHLIYWNVDARQDNIPMKVKGGVSFVSGMSPSIFQQIMSGKTAYDLMYEVLDSERYACIK